jgi:hypothetical protein
MPATSRADVIAIAPELDSVAADDPRWAAFLTQADALPAGVWGRLLGQGAANLVAHKLTLSVRQQRTGGRGAVLSESVGGISRTYAAPASGDPQGFDATTYGAEYRRLARLVGGGPR